MAGIALSPDGIAVAHVLQRPGEVPVLARCEFREAAALRQEQVLGELAREHRLGDCRCVSVAAQRDFSLLLVEAPQVDPTELKAAVRWRIRELLDFHIDDAVIDVFDIPGQRERGRPKLMYVVAARMAAVKQHIGLLERAGAQLEVIDIPELCQRNLAAQLPEDQNGVAFLRLGHGDGLLTLTRDGALYLARTIDFGVAQLKEDGERLVEALVLEVQRSLDYYESYFSLPPISALVMAPTEEPLPGVINQFAASLGIPVRVLDLNAVFETGRTLPDALQARCLTAIGAALRREEKAL
ncbi:MAG: pilus assembly protein PilM [Thiohalomonadaceae bacterium]